MKNQAQLLGLVLVLAAGAGCYNPNIKNGGLLCNTDTSKGPACPDDYSCVAGRCVRNGTDAGLGGSGGSDGGIKDTGATDAVDGGACFTYTPPASCATPLLSSMTCDPLCQKGCSSSGSACQKCNLVFGSSGAWTEACTPLAGSKPEGEACSRTSDATGTYTYFGDSCAPGLTCMPGGETTCWRCGKLCRSDSDCPGSRCYWQTSQNTKVCDFAPTTCNPITNDCADTSLSCYLLDDSTKTVCDCRGTKKLGESCEISRDCLPGHVCVAAAVGTAKLCRRVCRVGSTLSGCATSVVCNSYLGSTTYGYCAQ